VCTKDKCKTEWGKNGETPSRGQGDKEEQYYNFNKDWLQFYAESV